MTTPTLIFRSSLRFALLALLLASGLQAPMQAQAQEQVDVFDSPGSDTFTVPNGVTELTIEVWGGGGRGGTILSGTGGAGGGGGGAFASITLSVSPGETFSLFVGAGGNPGSTAPGGDSWFGNTSTVLAKGGSSSTTTNGAPGGSGADSIGDTTFSGGNGGNGGGGNPTPGGGGGSSAGFAAPGNNATGGTGANAPAGGGDGGDGGPGSTSEGVDGDPGQAPGGGGGGARGQGNSGATGGPGADGRVQVRYTPQPVNLAVEYRMGQSDWTGAADEVLDTSGSERHATAVGGADTDDEQPAIDGNPGTCRYGEFDGINDGIDEPDADDYLNGLSAITVMAWVYNSAALSGNNRGIFFTNNTGTQDNRLGMRYDTSGFFGGGNNVIKASVFTDDCALNQDCLQVETVSNVMVQNEWQHVAMTWVSGGDIKIFVDGDEVGISAVEGSGGNGTIAAVNALNIGQSAMNQRWQGRIDEFRIFDGALSPSEIQTWKDTTAPCEVLLPDHIRLLHPGSGLTCQPSEITVQACADSDCMTDFDEEVTVDLASTAGNWSMDPVTFTSGTAAVNLRVTSPGTVTLGATAINPGANGQTRCFNGSIQTNCEMQWFESGFVIDVPDHVSDTGQPGTVTAVRSDETSEACTSAFPGETRTVGFWFGYLNPGSGDERVFVNTMEVGENSPGTGIELTFDGNGVAPINVRYPDVGNVQLNARFEGSEDDEIGLVMTGEGSFIARPDHFTLDIPGNPVATDAGGPVFRVAGADFDINVQARNFNGNITPNFGLETTPESVALESTLLEPSGGNNAAIIGEFDSFGQDCAGNSAPGTACGTFSWTEVGIIEITPRLKAPPYLTDDDNDNIVGDSSDPVGRFIPSHFNLSASALTDRVDLDGCTDTFTYIGEPFGADWTLDARNADGVTTANYTDAFAKLSASDLGIAADEPITVDPSPIVWDDGFATVSAKISANRNVPAGPYEEFQVGTAPADSDGVTLRPVDLNIDLESPAGDDHVLIGTTVLRFGRLALDNAVGSELGELTLPLRAEYFVNSTWQVNTLDNCTEISLTDDVELTGSNGDTGNGTITVNIGSGTSIEEAAAVDPADRVVTLTGGNAGFKFSAPDSPGWVELLLSLDMDWHFLRDDLDDDGNYLENPNARATFGLFEGDENRILIQEIPPR